MSEKSKIFKHSLIIPVLFIIVIWIVKLYEYTLNMSFADYGILPRDLSGLKGILFMPFLHGDFEHLISNSVPVLILAFAIIYFYRGIGYKVIGIIWFMSGLLTWAFAIQDNSHHIGASGLVYGFAAFLFVSGTIRKDRNLLAIALAVAFAYGSMVWGIFPLKQGISWEGHLMGMISGIVLAIIYRDEGPKRRKWSWEIEEEEEERLQQLGKDIDENITYFYEPPGTQSNSQRETKE